MSYFRRMLAVGLKNALAIPLLKLRLQRGHALENGTFLIVVFHRVEKRKMILGYDQTVLSGEPEDFERGVAFLKRYFTIVPLEAILRAWRGREDVLPGRTLVLTFDDGYKDNFKNALPILRRHGIPATFFISTDVLEGRALWADRIARGIWSSKKSHVRVQGLGSLDVRNNLARLRSFSSICQYLKGMSDWEKEKCMREIFSSLDVNVPLWLEDSLYLTADEIRCMRGEGFSFGSHSSSHPILTRVDRERAWAEIAGSKSKLESVLGDEVPFFSYPNGLESDFNDEIVDMVRRSGYSLALTGIPGVNRLRNDPFRLRRIVGSSSFANLCYKLWMVLR